MLTTAPVGVINAPSMRKYLALAQLAIQRQITYRSATLAGLATNIFFGLLRAAVMVALYASQTEVLGMTLQDAVTYTGISQASIAYLSLFSWFEVIYSVGSGQVGADLLKPMDYYFFWMSVDFGKAIVSLALRGLTVMAFYALVFDISYPTSLGQWILLVISLALAWSVSFAYRFLVNLASFWSPNALGFCRLFYALSWFMSGFFMPLRLMPEWFQQLCALTPFPSMVNAVVEIYLGIMNTPEMIRILTTQVIWLVALYATGQLVLRLGLRRLVIQGG